MNKTSIIESLICSAREGNIDHATVDTKSGKYCIYRFEHYLRAIEFNIDILGSKEPGLHEVSISRIGLISETVETLATTLTDYELAVIRGLLWSV